MLARISAWCFDHRLAAVGVWLASIVAVFGAAGAVGPAWDGSFEIPDSESADGLAVVDEFFSDQGGSAFDGKILWIVEDGEAFNPGAQAALEGLFDEIHAGFPNEETGVPENPGATVSNPFQSAVGQANIASQGPNAGSMAFAQVNFTFDTDQTESALIGEKIFEYVENNEQAFEGMRVELGGAALGEFEPPESELIGLGFAVVVLILAFGSVMAMGLPIAVAVGGVGVGIGLTTLLSNTVTIPDFGPTIGAMIGLGVGIDYALFIVTRYREGTAKGMSPRQATVAAMDTAGRAVIFAGMTVVISLLGMLLMGLKFISGLGISASVTVLVTMIASTTLLPALLGFAQERIEITKYSGLIAAGFVALALLALGLGQAPLAAGAGVIAVVVLLARFAIKPLNREVPRRIQKPIRETFWYRWSHFIQEHPWQSALGGTAVLLLLAAPLLSLRLGFSDEGNFPEGTTTRESYDLIAEGFGPGFNGPLLVTATAASPADAQALQADVVPALLATPGIASVVGPIPNNQADPSASEAFMLQVIPTTSPQDQATNDLVTSLRDTVVPEAVAGTGLDLNVTGATAANIDFTDFMAQRVLIFFAAVLGASFLLLMMVFRSLLVPLKAVIMNILSIASAYGVVVAVFQWGWGGSLLGIDGAPIEPFIPMMLFAIVFGLSMDYEVFLLSRIKEEYDRTGNAKDSVADGLAATARVITAAAAIMVVVFGSFMFEDNRIIKLFGLGLALAVLLDATLVRMLLVPATMELLGEKNWWIPKWLDRILPRINVEGPAGHELPEDQHPADPGDLPQDPDRQPVRV